MNLIIANNVYIHYFTRVIETLFYPSRLCSSSTRFPGCSSSGNQQLNELYRLIGQPPFSVQTFPLSQPSRKFPFFLISCVVLKITRQNDSIQNILIHLQNKNILQVLGPPHTRHLVSTTISCRQLKNVVKCVRRVVNNITPHF